jgi:hypothetical protein
MPLRPGKTREIAVLADDEGIPLTFTLNRQQYKVLKIYDQWRIYDAWWGDEVKRDYFRVQGSRDRICDIYHDMVADRWYLTKVHG